MNAFKLNEASLSEIARGRRASLLWRTTQGVGFALGAGFVLNSAWIAAGWLAALGVCMVADFVFAQRCLAAQSPQRRRLWSRLFIAACASTFITFAVMAFYVGLAGGAEGRLLGVLMAASTLVSVMSFSFNAPLFMVMTAAPCTFVLLAAPFMPTIESPAPAWAGAIGVAFGIVGLLGYVARSATTSRRLMVGLEAAHRAAKDRQVIAETRQAEAEEASRVKSEFLTTMTHELRTPLNAVIGYSEIIGEDMEAEGFKDLAQDATRITAAAKHLLGLIDQILQLTQIDAGRSSVELDELDVRKLIESAVAAIGDQAKTNNNRLATRIAPDVTTAFTDSEKLGVCVAHLLSNAAKFTHNGLVAVSAERESADGREWLRIAVSDTGIGMTQAEIAKAFQPFTQLDASTTRTQGGMGLGLSITTRTAEALGGEVIVTSEPGAGSTFTLRVPMRFSHAQSLNADARIGAAA